MLEISHYQCTATARSGGGRFDFLALTPVSPASLQTATQRSADGILAYRIHITYLTTGLFALRHNFYDPEGMRREEVLPSLKDDQSR
jgi:hypothetical protein